MAVFGIIFVAEIEQNQEMWCLLINFLFIELILNAFE